MVREDDHEDDEEEDQMHEDDSYDYGSHMEGNAYEQYLDPVATEVERVIENEYIQHGRNNHSRDQTAIDDEEYMLLQDRLDRNYRVIM